MRRFADREGREWEVVAGRESWGTCVAIFVPADGGEDLRQASLDAEAPEAAVGELERLDERALLDLLERSVRKEIGG